jgi:hypothetical protein
MIYLMTVTVTVTVTLPEYTMTGTLQLLRRIANLILQVRLLHGKRHSHRLMHQCPLWNHLRLSRRQHQMYHLTFGRTERRRKCAT